MWSRNLTVLRTRHVLRSIVHNVYFWSSKLLYLSKLSKNMEFIKNMESITKNKNNCWSIFRRKFNFSQNAKIDVLDKIKMMIKNITLIWKINYWSKIPTNLLRNFGDIILAKIIFHSGYWIDAFSNDIQIWDSQNGYSSVITFVSGAYSKSFFCDIVLPIEVPFKIHHTIFFVAKTGLSKFQCRFKTPYFAIIFQTNFYILATKYRNRGQAKKQHQ